ncbi:MAG: GTPase ObgE [Eubacteriales bacterium]|nr:GTPase ObgE [Eubacteriales bacterium]
MFTDTARIIIKSGKGGDGHVSFRREKYVPDGGPNGGDGGKGGDLIFEVDNGLNTLNDYHIKRKFAAENGEEGGGNRCHGKSGKDLVLRVPYGTIVREAASGKIITDMSGDNRREVILRGGKGGLGNMHFATSTMQAPRFAQPGQQGIELEVKLELKCIADVGLVGFPNVGKSSIITMASNAKPQIANYHFTTLTPHLGVVGRGYESFVMADIPGIIEGASEGAGLGFDFLRHIERCRILLHVVDAAGSEGRNPIEDIEKINNELFMYDENLLKRPMIIAANKTDISDEYLDEIKAKYEDVYPICAATGEGIPELINRLFDVLKENPDKPVIYEKEYDVYEHLTEELPLEIFKESADVYVVQGPRIEKMLGYTKLESEKGFAFFQRYMKEQKIIDELIKLGLEEGDTVRVGGLEFEYYE